MSASEYEDSDSDSPFEYASSCESSEEEEEDELWYRRRGTPWTANLDDDELTARVIELCSMHCCKKRCFDGKQSLVQSFVCSINAMPKEARKTAFLTSLAISAYAEIVVRKRGSGRRERFAYLLPFCGTVCRVAFQAAYNVSNDTLTKARGRVQDGDAFVAPHKNTSNKHAASVNHEQVVGWIRQIATQLGEPCPVRFRRQRTTQDTTVRYTTRQTITFLPAYFTWGRLYGEFVKYLGDHDANTQPPSFSSFFQTIAQRCKDVRVRSPRANVCDVCTIYRIQSSSTPTAIETENQATHALDARAMREQYAKDKGLIGSKRFMSTIDFAQSIALPHQGSTPSAWYFMSLIGVSLFGIHTENSDRQMNFIYSERVAGKGSNEVISMLHEYALRTKIYSDGPGTASWTIYADNCGGQNKNNHLLRYLRFLVDSKRLRSAGLYFLVKGHTKNNCDRGFGAIKRSYARKDVYTMAHVADVIVESSSKNSVVNLEDVDGVFVDWKTSLQTIYKDIKNIQSYQLFNFGSNTPGTVNCRKRPSGAAFDQAMSKMKDPDYDSVWKSLKPVPKCGANPEKVTDLHAKILPYIPVEYQDDDLYRAPTASEVEAGRQRKRRRKVTPTLEERNMATQDQEEKETS